MVGLNTGQAAETAVAEYLEDQGYEILDRNWKTQSCEIDVVAKRQKTVCFVEVKYRVGSAQGSGLEYILPRKLKQMEFAARVWNQQHGWDGDWRLLAAAVSGSVGHHIDLIEIF